MAVNLNAATIKEDSSTSITIQSSVGVDSIYSDREKDIEKSIDDIINKHKALTLKANEISEQNGINYDSVLSVESIMPGLLTRNLPYGGFTHEFSKTNLAISLEAIHAGKVGLILGAITLICGIIYKIVQKVISFFGGNSKNIENTRKNIEETSAKIKEIEEKLDEKIEPIKSEIVVTDHKVEVIKWITENKDVSNLISRVSHLYTGFTGEDISKLGLYEQLVKFLSYKESNKSNNQISKLSNKLPNILFSSEVEHDVNTYIDFYMFIKNNIENLDKDVNNFKINVWNSITGKPIINIKPHVDLLDTIGRVVNTRYQDPAKAMQAMTKQIQTDWLTKHAGPITSEQVTRIKSLVISDGNNPSKITDFIVQLSDNKLTTDLKTLTERIESELTDPDSQFQREKRSMEKILEQNPKERANRLVLMDAHLNKFKEHLDIIKAVTVSLGVFGPKFIEALVQINTILMSYLAYISHFDDLLEMYSNKFKE